MIHLEKLVFLLLMAAGATIYVGLRGNTFDQWRGLAPIQRWIEHHVWQLIAGLASIITIITYLAATNPDFVEWPGIRHLNTPAFAKVPLALLCGVLFAELASLVRKANFSPLYLAVRAVPFTFFFAIGFFSYELRQTVDALTRIEAAGFTVDFDSQAPHETQSLIDEGGGTTDTRTPFQLGISLLPEAIDTASVDETRIKKWCGTFEALDCAVERQEAPNNHNSLPLDELYSKTVEYVRLLDPLRECLHGVYANYFPNGSPIQDELSEFAAALSTEYAYYNQDNANDTTALDLIESGIYKMKAANQSEPTDALDVILIRRVNSSDASPSLSGDQSHLQRHLIELRDKLVQFGQYAHQYNSPTDSEAIAACRELKPDSRGQASVPSHVLNIENLVKIRRELTGEDVPSGRFDLPYVSIFEAAIIAASGYPEEAARHLEREYAQLTNPDQERHSGIAQNGFSEFLLEIRLLSPLEHILAYSRNQALQVVYAGKLVDRVESQLERIKKFENGMRSKFIQHCATNQLFPKNKQLDDSLQGETRSDIENYFRNIIHFYLRTYARLLETLALDPNAMTSSKRFEKFSRVAEDLGELASAGSSALGACIGPSLRDNIRKFNAETGSNIDEASADTAVELLRFDLLAAYGFILARQADRHEVDPEIAPNIDRAFKRDLVCKTQRVLLSAWRIQEAALPDLKKAEPESTRGSAYSRKIRRIRQVLEDINRSGVQCVT